jgi:site-specific recombinase XerD
MKLETNPLRLAQGCEVFLNHCRVGKSLSPHSLRAYAIDLAEFQRYLGVDMEVHNVDRETLRGYLSYLMGPRKLSPASVKRRIACLKAFFRWLELEDSVPVTPFHRMDLRIRLTQRLPRGLSREETTALLSAARRPFLHHSGSLSFDGCQHRPDRFNALTSLLALELLYASAVRVSELCALTAGDVLANDANGLRVHGKGNRERWVPITDDLLKDQLRHYLTVRDAWQPTSYPPIKRLLINSKGMPLTPTIIRKRLAALTRSAPLSRHVTPHMIRHTTATHLLQNGLDLRHTQRLLGHSSISTTEIYTAVSDRSLEEAMKRIQG